ATPFLSDPAHRGVQLAGRLRLRGGSLSVDERDLTTGEFCLYRLADDGADIPVPGTVRRGARALPWTLKVEPASARQRFGDFVFRGLEGPGEPSVIRLAPLPGERELVVDVRNCEQEEIGRYSLPTTYEEGLHRRELLAFYPLLEAWQNGLPQCKLAPLADRG